MSVCFRTCKLGREQPNCINIPTLYSRIMFEYIRSIIPNTPPLNYNEGSMSVIDAVKLFARAVSVMPRLASSMVETDVTILQLAAFLIDAAIKDHDTFIWN